MRRHLLLTALFPALLAILFTFASTGQAEILPGKLVRNGGYIISNNGAVLEQFRQEELFQTASTIKLLTALAVLDTLGKDYRYTTSFYIDDRDVLYVRGSGDPFLTSEYLSQIADELRTSGIDRITGYVLDDSFFGLEQPLPDGSDNSFNPYDAPNGALAINFNTVALIKKQDGSAGTGEAQTPTVPITVEIAQHLPPGRHRININHVRLAGSISPQLRYTAEILHELLRRNGVESTPVIRRGTIPQQARQVYAFTSPKTVEEILQSCLHFSNNFIANQLILTAAAKRYDSPATWNKAQKLLSNFAENTLNIPADQFCVVEGSGLSRENRMTPEGMLILLERFLPFKHLLPRKKGVILKSGTMEAVYCYAGYLEKKESNISFVLLLNQKENTRGRLLSELKKNLPPS